MQDNRKTGIGGKVLLALTMIFFYLPILVTMVFSFNSLYFPSTAPVR